MPAFREARTPVKAVKNGRFDRPAPLRTHMPTPGHGDEHMGATEEQMRPTLPPRAEDDEPRQG
jgi:hypothetical protein